MIGVKHFVFITFLTFGVSAKINLPEKNARWIAGKTAKVEWNIPTNRQNLKHVNVQLVDDRSGEPHVVTVIAKELHPSIKSVEWMVPMSLAGMSPIVMVEGVMDNCEHIKRFSNQLLIEKQTTKNDLNIEKRATESQEAPEKPIRAKQQSTTFTTTTSVETTTSTSSDTTVTLTSSSTTTATTSSGALISSGLNDAVLGILITLLILFVTL